MKTFLILTICFYLFLKWIDYERYKISKNTKPKKGQVDEKIYLKWKKGQL